MSTALTRISDHVYWLPPDKPDRPSLCAVVGAQHTLMLDAGASAAHARLFLNALAAAGVAAPRYVALTHWHWDHIFGAAALGIPVIAGAATTQQISIQAAYTWDDAALDQRVAAGLEIAECTRNIKLELPEPREVRIVIPDIVYQDSLRLNLGGVTCHLRHAGGDHAADSCVMYVEPDRVLFLGDCLYDAIYAPVRHYTIRHLFPLLDTLRVFDAHHIIEGHTPAVMSSSEFNSLMDRLRQIGSIVQQVGADEPAALAAAQARFGQPLDEDTDDLVRALVAGRAFE